MTLGCKANEKSRQDVVRVNGVNMQMALPCVLVEND